LVAAAAEHNQEVPSQTAFLAAPVVAALEMRALVIMVWARLEHQAKAIVVGTDTGVVPQTKAAAAAALVLREHPDRLIKVVRVEAGQPLR
jgi:hypothetical protein